MTTADLAKVQKMITDANAKLLADFKTALAADTENKTTGWSSGFPGRTDAQFKDDLQTQRNFLNGNPDKQGQQVPSNSPLARIVQAADLVIADHSGTVHSS
jgi:hypothetical protein